MAQVLLPSLPATSSPFGTRAGSWTVVDDDVVVCGGAVTDLAAMLRHLARAAELVPSARVLSDLSVDPSVPCGPGALVVVDALSFEANSLRLDGASHDAFLVAVGSAAEFDEVLVWIGAGNDLACTSHDAAELSRRRVAAIIELAERSGSSAATVRVERRHADLTVIGGARRPAPRRYAVRIRRV